MNFSRIRATDDEWNDATATYFKEPAGGACGDGDFKGKEFSAGLSSALFERGRVCGVCFELRCVDHVLWCLSGSPSVNITATDFCPPNYGLPSDYGGWCNYPSSHFELSKEAFKKIAVNHADFIPVQYRRVKCQRRGGIRFTLRGRSPFFQVLITNVGLDGEVTDVKVKGSTTGWNSLGRNWGQFWQGNMELKGQPLSFEVATKTSRVISYHAAPSNWQFGQTYVGKQFSEVKA